MSVLPASKRARGVDERDVADDGVHAVAIRDDGFVLRLLDEVDLHHAGVVLCRKLPDACRFTDLTRAPHYERLARGRECPFPEVGIHFALEVCHEAS